MRPSEIWNYDSVIIETGLPDGVVGASLIADGVTNYLGVSADPNRIDAAKKVYPLLASFLTSAAFEHYMNRNNAKVLILSGITPLCLWRYRIMRHSEQVAWKAGVG